MNIEIKKSVKPVNYIDAINIMEERLEQIFNNKKNDLEPIVLKKFRNISKPLFFLKSLKEIEFVRMTGSGSSFVAYFKSKKNLLNASKLFTNKYKKYWSVMSKTI